MDSLLVRSPIHVTQPAFIIFNIRLMALLANAEEVLLGSRDKTEIITNESPAH